MTTYDPKLTHMQNKPSLMPRYIYIKAGLTPKDCRAILAGISRPSAEVNAQEICDRLNDEITQSIAIIQEIVDSNGTRAKVLTPADLAEQSGPDWELGSPEWFDACPEIPLDTSSDEENPII